MNKLLLALGLCFITMCSFMCTKSNDDVVMRSQMAQDNNVTIDMSQFPGHTQFTIMDENSHAQWFYDSDSLKTYHSSIPGNTTYTIKWKLMGLSIDKRYKAFIRYHDKSNLNSEWESNVYIQKGWKIWGDYTFTKELK